MSSQCYVSRSNWREGGEYGGTRLIERLVRILCKIYLSWINLQMFLMSVVWLNSFLIASYPVDFMFHGKTVRVKGRFPLMNPWWEISCSAQQYAYKLVVSGYPSYKLRTDDWRTLLSLFLNACIMNSDFVMRFMKWLPADRYVDPVNLEEAVHEFGESVNATRAEADYVKLSISKSGIRGMLLKAFCLFNYK